MRLAAEVANPVNQAKILGGLAQGKGLTYPGSKYIGPGNAMDLGTPTSEADRLAMQHDQEYDDYLKAGLPPIDVYTKYSSADKRLLKKAKKKAHKDPQHLALVLGMGAKKLAHDMKLTKSLD